MPSPPDAAAPAADDARRARRWLWLGGAFEAVALLGLVAILVDAQPWLRLFVVGQLLGWACFFRAMWLRTRDVRASPSEFRRERPGRRRSPRA